MSCIAFVWQKEEDFRTFNGDFDLKVISPDYLHPVDARAFAQQTIEFSKKSKHRIAYFTRNPYVIDQFDCDNVIVMIDCEKFRLSDHPKWEQCKGVFSSGEFFASLERDEPFKNAEAIKSEWIQLDPASFSDQKLYHSFNGCGHPLFKFNDEIDDIHLIAHRIITDVLKRRFPKTKSAPNWDNPIECVMEEFPNINATNDFQIYFGIEESKFTDVTIEFPAGSYRLLVQDDHIVIEITDASKLKILSYDRC